MRDEAVKEVAYDEKYDPREGIEGSGGEYASYFSVRLRVFCEKQKISIDDGVDGKDAERRHYAIFRGNLALAVCRLSIEPPYAKVERVACLKEGRGRGYARRLMLEVISIVDRDHPNAIVVALAQTTVLKFY
ncbi:hypothetical protein PENTCL1PPCAC_8700 [Pristionchus entomophagus]|uniref:N-acetyltransferase domain-containing protein n=1 Tax=Pristionchus entomophagus TaxID=358040 RepID=A0AAV5STW2_9BILA|nr:hypothetical protein PENTCL1PPCAC_8700 [Pristionchus entomophagus]